MDENIMKKYKMIKAKKVLLETARDYIGNILESLFREYMELRNSSDINLPPIEDDIKADINEYDINLFLIFHNILNIEETSSNLILKNIKDDV